MNKIKMLRRSVRFWWQRLSRGFDDSETWSLDWAIAKLILPRLQRFKDVNNGFPHGFTEETWDQSLDKMIKAFEIIVESEGGNFDMLVEKDVEEGLDLFRKYYFDLWW